eukprot:430810-Pyramimonas_sp.AAC.1
MSLNLCGATHVAKKCHAMQSNALKCKATQSDDNHCKSMRSPTQAKKAMNLDGLHCNVAQS